MKVSKPEANIMIAKYTLDKMARLEETGNHSPSHAAESRICQLAMDGLALKGYCVAVDFDGTLCDNQFPYIGKPRKDVVEQIKALQSYGVRTILWTCRDGNYLQDAVAWCEDQGLHFDEVNNNLPERISQWGNDPRKVSADEYWDDKSVAIL